MSDTPQILLARHLKVLKPPTFPREYDKVARQSAAEGVDHTCCLLRLAELELIDRDRGVIMTDEIEPGSMGRLAVLIAKIRALRH